jgi:hypothetical protein
MISPKYFWNDHFSGSPATTLNSSQFISRQTHSYSSVYVLNCLFTKCTETSGHGGALCCASATCVFIESSFFFSCKTTSGEGGAVYFSNSGGQCVFYKVCGYDCCSTSYGPFTHTTVKNAVSSMNYVNYTSVIRCVNDVTNAYETLRLDCGNVYCPSVNVSMNRCRSISVMVCTPTTGSSSVTCTLSYSTFADNSATQYGCIWCNSGGANYEIKYSNILRNAHNYNTYGIFFARGNLKVADSCILGNKGNYIFYQESSSYKITLSNCTVDTITYNSYLTIQSTVTKSFIHGLHHMTTQNCHAQYDSEGTLTAIPYVSHSTKKKFPYTYHCQARISDSFPLISLFVLTFIHSKPPGYCWNDRSHFCA